MSTCKSHKMDTTRRSYYSFVVFILVIQSLGTEQFDTAVQRQQPGLNAPNKLWWAKEITPDFHIAGRLTERQIKYASEGGFRSILSLFVYETDDVGNFGGERLPTSADAWAVSHLAGLQYLALIGVNDDWASVETIQKFADVIGNLRKPVLLHCDRGYTVTFVTLMYMANQTRYNTSFEPKIYSNEFYRITAAMGLDFTSDDLKEIVANITGEEFVKDPPKHNCNPSEWLDFWLAHPVSRNWYTAGQIRKCDILVLEATGFKTIINMRLGVVTNKSYSQEPVNLLNIKDGTSTYGDIKTVSPRQDLITLEKSRINPHLSGDYVTARSKRNYEVENSLEFGDDIGYNEHLEEDVVNLSNMKYYHIPIPPSGNYSVDMFREVKDILLTAGQQGPVLLHCADGRRVAYIGVLAAAIQEGQSLGWALQRVQDLGFQVSPESRPDIYNLYCDTLTKDKKMDKEEL